MAAKRFYTSEVKLSTWDGVYFGVDSSEKQYLAYFTNCVGICPCAKIGTTAQIIQTSKKKMYANGCISYFVVIC